MGYQNSFYHFLEALKAGFLVLRREFSFSLSLARQPESINGTFFN